MNDRRYLLVKRGLDVTVAGVGLIAISPLFVCIAIAVAYRLGWPVFFTQVRPGLGGRPFRVYKFRTMRTPDARRGMKSDEDRLTPFGRWLRSTSLDELPSLVNVIKGEMSLVGPRPLLLEYLPLYSERHAQRHNMKPGLTGHAQVNGRNSIPWPEKFDLDIDYIEKCSLGFDMRILAQTALKVIQRDGISAEGHVTVGPFVGYETNEAD